jgi:IS605 OrfB family transposase
VYSRLDESKDKTFYQEMKIKFSLNDIELRSIISKAEQIKNAFLSKVKKTQDEIDDLLNYLEEEKDKLSISKSEEKTKKIKKNIFRLERKLARKQKLIKSDIVFGSRKLLQRLSFLNNNKTDNQKEIQEVKKEYTKKRLGSIFLMGEANQKANRFFSFDFQNNIITYKPYNGKKIDFTVSKWKNIDWNSLNDLIQNKQIPITVSIDEEYIYLTFDESIVSGYAINKSERSKEVKEATVGVFDKEEKKKITNRVYVEYYRRLDERMAIGKLSNRYFGIDLNPEYIGYTIMDKLNDTGEFRIVDRGCFDFHSLCKKSGESSDDPISIHKNNKRKFERTQVICELFKLMKHYKCAHFVMEDLNFKDSNDKQNKEFNRKVKNIWDRELLSNLINKKCTEGGYQLVEVNPIFTSLIGNASNQVFDPVASSSEITRRGCFQYNKGSFYPNKNDKSILRTTSLICKRNHIDVEGIRDLSWRELHTTFNQFRYRWGALVGKTNSLRLKSHRSGIVHTLYSIT